MRKINSIIIHCSDSEWGDAGAIHRWHTKKGWHEIGYHYVILNNNKTDWHDGSIQMGRSIEDSGAHCIGQNQNSIGICLIGKEDFTVKQFQALGLLLTSLMAEYDLNVSNIHCHNEYNSNKTCPNIEIDVIRSLVTPNNTFKMYQNKP